MALTDAGAGRQILYDNRKLGGCITLVLAGTVKAGDPLGFSTGWKKADGDTGPISAEYIACQDGVSGDEINVCTEAVLTGGITLGTAGNPVFLGATGLWVDAALSGSGNDKTPYGTTIDATTIHVSTTPGKRGYAYV